MSIIVKGNTGTTFTPHPEGQYAARCIDVVDLGWMPGSTMYPDPKYKIRLVFFCGEWTEEKEVEIDGQKVRKRFPMLVMSQFTASLNEKANLRKFARGWRGQDFTDEEVNGGFDFERMVGAPAFLQIEHNTKGDKTYANIGSVMRLPKGQDAPETPSDYVRVCERPDWSGPNPHPDHVQSSSQDAPPSTDGEPWPDDDLPFAPTRLWAPLFFGW